MKIVLLPGLDGTGILFKPFIEALPIKTEIQIISYPLSEKLNYQELSALVMSQLPKEQFILVAESFSGYIAYQVALRNPNNLKSVVFVATFLESPRPFILALSRLLPRSRILSAPIPNHIIKIFLFGSAVNIKLIRLFKQSMKQVSPQILSYRLQEIEKLSNSPQSSEIRATYIQATNDKLVPKRCIDNFEKTFNNLNVFKIEGSHFILQGNPVACAEIIANEIAL